MKAHRLLFAFAVAFGAAACELIEPEDTDPPIVFNLGVELGPYDPVSGTMGGFVMDTSLSSIFTELGPAGPTFDFSFVLATGAQIVSPISGKVSSLSFDPAEDDYTLRIRPKTDSVWSVIIDHLAEPVVADGDTLAAGDAIGVAAESGGYGQLSLRIDDKKEDESWCPWALFDVATIGTVASDFSATLNRFETLKGDPTVWDESDWPNFPGCQSDTVPF